MRANSGSKRGRDVGLLEVRLDLRAGWRSVEFGAVTDGAAATESEQVHEGEDVASGVAGFGEQPVGAVLGHRYG
jgi:hypothetical protein